ncbi:MAG: hypothetical protein ABI867_34055 [Kofleriaceae bacterium]
MSKRVALVAGALAAVIAIVLVAHFATSSSSTTATENPAATTRSSGGRAPGIAGAIAQARARAHATEAAGDPGTAPVTSDKATPAADGRVPNTDRVGAGAIRQPPSAVPVDVDKAIERYEARNGTTLTKSERKVFEDQMKKSKVDPVPGVTSMRGKILAMQCSGPDAQSKYNGMSEPERAAMKKRCGAAGAALTDPR